MAGMSNPLGPNHQDLSASAPSDASAGLRQQAPMQAMQLPVGSMVTHPPLQPLTHHSTQMQTQPHFQQPLTNPRMYQSFADALAESSQPLTGPSMHSIPSHGPSQGLFSQPQSAQGMSMASQGMSSQASLGQGLSLQPHSGQGAYLQPRMGHGIPLQPLPEQHEGGMSIHASAGSVLPNGIAHGQSLPDGSAQMSSHL